MKQKTNPEQSSDYTRPQQPTSCTSKMWSSQIESLSSLIQMHMCKCIIVVFRSWRSRLAHGGAFYYPRPERERERE